MLAQERQIQSEIAIERYVTQFQKLHSVAFQVLTGSTPLCNNKIRYDLGFNVTTINDFPPEFQQAARKKLKVDERLTVISLPKNSPARKKGLKTGDKLIRINNHLLPKGPNAIKRFAQWHARVITNNRTATIEAVRKDINGYEKPIKIRYNPIKKCNYPVILAESDSINAYADGKLIGITKGMLRFVDNDEELAIVIAHELAHNVMGHVRAKKVGSMLGSIADIAIEQLSGIRTGGMLGKMGALRYSKAYESEADYVGAYMMALSNYDYHKAAYLWRRMAAENPRSIEQGGMLASHPASPERFLQLENAAQEIDQKKASGKTLRPEYRR